MAAPPGAGALVEITPFDEIVATGRASHSRELPVSLQMRLDLQWTDPITLATTHEWGAWSDTVECLSGVAKDVAFGNTIPNWGVGTIAYRWGLRLIAPDGSAYGETFYNWVGAAYMIYAPEAADITIELVDLTIVPH